MKKIITLFCVFFFTITAFSQVGINNNNPAASSILDINWAAPTLRGFLTPRMTQAQRNLIASPADGLLIYQTNNSPGFYYYNGTAWRMFGSNAWSITGNAGTDPLLNYVGTTDANAYVMQTNATERMRILANGKVGLGTATPTIDLQINGNIRLQDGSEGLDKILSSSANGTATWLSPNALGYGGWDLIGTSGTDPSKNYIGTADNQDFVIRTNNTERIRVQSDGNVRINLSAATTSKLQVSNNTPNSSTIFGKNTNTTANTFSFGVTGESRSIILGTSGIQGVSVNFSPSISEIGVLGRYTNFGAGVFGRGWTDVGGANTLTNFPTSNYSSFLSNRHYGVYGLVDYNGININGPGGAYGVYGRNTNTTIGSAYGLYCQGNFAVAAGYQINNGSGTVYPNVKSASVPTTKGNQLVYCKESPEMWFEDFGFGQLVNGVAHVSLDAIYLETIKADDQHKMHITLQEQAETNGLIYTVDRDYKGFTVKERNNGTSNADFSYSIMAKRRFYQDQRFGVDSNQPFGDNLAVTKQPELLSQDPMVVKAMVEQAIREKNEKYANSVAEKAPEKTVEKK